MLGSLLALVILCIGFGCICCGTFSWMSFGKILTQWVQDRHLSTNILTQRKLVSFPTAVNKYVKGGDLIFFEDTSFFDDYTYLNS